MAIAFKYPSYTTMRMKPLRAYVDHMTHYLRLYHPEVPQNEVQEFVETYVKTHIQGARADVLVHPRPGVTERVDVDLLQHLHGNIAQNIITPSGSTYVLPTVRESFLKTTLKEKVAERKFFKGIYLSALASGDIFTAETNNFLQASTKIFTNSIPGATGSEHNILYDLPGYNSVTSTARLSVKYGYAHVERLVEGNLYVTSEDQIINYCIIHLRAMPKEWPVILTQYALHAPSIDEFVAYFTTSLRYYVLELPTDRLLAFASRLTAVERAYIFYVGNLRNLVRFNDVQFRTFFQELFRTDLSYNQTTEEITAVFSIEKDLLAMITSLNYEALGIDPDTGNYYELDQAMKKNPDGVRKILTIGRHMEATLDQLAPLLECLFRADVDLPRVREQERMIRRCVLISDTDSVIFSTQSMVEWYSGEITYKRNSYEINAFTVYLISRTLEHAFARLSCGLGMIKNDVYLISMKNEFLYPIMMRATIKKHYAGISTIQEGKLLAKPKKDIKGLQFRSSTLSTETNQVTEAFLTKVLTAIMQSVKLSLKDILTHVANFELKVYRSLLAGERTFLSTASIKGEDDYDDPDRTNYFYYTLWQEVFVPEFDAILLPNKCFKLPLRNNGKILKDPLYIQKWVAAQPKTYEKFETFCAKWPKKTIATFLMAPTLMAVPEFFRDAVDMRAIVHNNCKPLYLTLESLGFGAAYTKANHLVTDFFNPTTTDIAFD